MCIEGKMYQTNPYQSAAKGQPLLWRLESAGGMWNLERTQGPGSVLLCADDPRRLPRQLDPKSQAVTGEGWPSRQEEAKRDFLGTQAMPGAPPACSESQLSWHMVGFRSGVGSPEQSHQRWICV